MPAFTLGALLDDQSPMPEDIIAPRVLTPGGLLVLGGAPKVGKSDLLISWLVHMAAGVPFLGFTPPRPLRIFYLQAEIQYHYLRERMKQIALPPEVLAAARDTFVATPKLKMLLDTEGSVRVARAVQTAFPDAPPDIICVDPIRNLFDGGPDGGGENDNTAMMFFLKERVEVLRDHIDPDCGVILVHHTKKLSKQQVKDDPFLALSGASALRGFYTSGLILHRPDEDCSQRKLEIELRNGPALPPKLIDKVGGEWVEINPMNERLVRQEVGAKHDAERDAQGGCDPRHMIAEQADQGRMFTLTQFAASFENKGSLGGQTSIRERLHVLATKGYVKFVRGDQVSELGLKRDAVEVRLSLRRGTCIFAPMPRVVDDETGEVMPELRSRAAQPTTCAPNPVRSCRSKTRTSGSIRTGVRHEFGTRNEPVQEHGSVRVLARTRPVFWHRRVLRSGILQSKSTGYARTQNTDCGLPSTHPCSGNLLISFNQSVTPERRTRNFPP